MIILIVKAAHLQFCLFAMVSLTVLFTMSCCNNSAGVYRQVHASTKDTGADCAVHRVSAAPSGGHSLPHVRLAGVGLHRRAAAADPLGLLQARIRRLR